MGAMSGFMEHVTEPTFSAPRPSQSKQLLIGVCSDDVIDAAWGAGIGVHALIWVCFIFAINIASSSNIESVWVRWGRQMGRQARQTLCLAQKQPQGPVCHPGRPIWQRALV